jgi:DNA-binding SARP family transcriptional activator
MPRFYIRLLGGFELRDPNARRISLATRKAEALVALLALRPGQALERDKLCALLWPDVQGSQALHSLRQTLVSVRKAFPDALLTQVRSVAFDVDGVQVDVPELEQQLRLGTLEALTRAARLYRGDLLDGLALREQPFELWVSFERERLRGAMTRGLAQLIDLHSEAGEFSEALEACSQLLKLDPWHEQTHRQLMRLQLRQGRRTSALSHYRSLVRSLWTELGTEPDAETQQLYAELGSAAAATGNSALERTALRRRRADAGVEKAQEPQIVRHAELEALRSAHASALAGSANGCLVLGEAGVGKTHLCEQFAAEVAADNARVLRARCFESEQVLPFSLWANLLRDAQLAQDLQLLAALPDAQRDELARLDPTIESSSNARPAQDALPLFRALEAVLLRWAETAQLTLMLEDLHWADEMSLRALCYLARRCAAFWVGTARPEDLERGGFLQVAIGELESERRLTRIRLEPFSKQDSVQFASGWASHLQLPVSYSTWVEQVWSISEGNALVIVESARAYAPEAAGVELERLPVPERVRALIQRRVLRVSQVAHELLSLAAVLGRELDLELARELFDAQQLVAAAEELVQHSLLRAHADRMVFTHDRVRETLYAEMLPARRRVLHAQVASALERQPGAKSTALLGQIGYHHSKAGNAHAAIPYLMRFADQARRGHALGEALAALEQAARDSAQVPAPQRRQVTVEIAIHKAFCLAFLGRSGELVTSLEQYAPELQALDRPELAAPYHFWWAFGLTVLGDSQAAEFHARRSLEHATSCGDARSIGFSHGILAYLCAMSGRWREGVQHGERSIALMADEQEMPEAPVLAAVNTHMNYLWLGDWQSALAAAQRAATSANQADSQRGRSLAATAEGFVYLHIERWQAALEAAQRALDASNSPLTLVYALWVFARAQLGSGNGKPAIALLEQMVTQLEAHGIRSLQAPVMMTFAEAKLQGGDLEGAARLANSALGFARELGSPITLGSALFVQGRVAHAQSNLQTAREHLDEAVRICEAFEDPIGLARTLVALAEIDLAQNDRHAALARLRRAHEHFATHHVEVPALRVAASIMNVSESCSEGRHAD